MHSELTLSSNCELLHLLTQARRKQNEEDELDALFTQYALALSFFERWCKRGADLQTITSTLNGYGERTQVRR